MSAPFRSRQRAEELAARVDGTPAAQRGPSTRSSAQGEREPDREMDRLVGIVSGLRRQVELDPLATPRAAYATSLRKRLMTEAPTVLAAQEVTPAARPRSRGKRERVLVAVATAGILLGGTAGMAAAAQNSLPGEALYPIKRGIEQADAELARSQAGRGRDLLQQATERLNEVQGLVDAGPADGAGQIPGTLEVFTLQAREGADLLMDAYQDTGHRKTIAVVRSFAADDLGVLTSLSDSTPDEAQPQLRKAALALQSIDGQASALCDDCSALGPLQIPGTLLVSAGAGEALHGAAADDRTDPAKRLARVADEPVGQPGAPATSPLPGMPTTVPVPGATLAPVVPAPPADSTAPPADSTAPPADSTAPPADTPTSPADTPSDTPSSPTDTPSDTPSTPSDTPTTPSDTASTPTDTASTPSDTPSSPADTPSDTTSASATDTSSPGSDGPTPPVDPGGAVLLTRD